jgi:hypothetical protein
MREAGEGSSVNKREYWYPRTKIPKVRTAELCTLEVDMTRGRDNGLARGQSEAQDNGRSGRRLQAGDGRTVMPQRTFWKEK